MQDLGSMESDHCFDAHAKACCMHLHSGQIRSALEACYLQVTGPAGGCSDLKVLSSCRSVNFKFLPEPVFQSKLLATALLAAHLALLWAFADRRWCHKAGGLSRAIQLCLSGPHPAASRMQVAAQPQSSQSTSHSVDDQQRLQPTVTSEAHVTGSPLAEGPVQAASPSATSSGIMGSQLQQQGGMMQEARHRKLGTGSVHAGSIRGAQAGALSEPRQHADAAVRSRLGPAQVLLILFSGNFLGILCARTLHFQFYSW